ncbi:transcriptional regulator [Desulfurobacterium sp. TC5-1]|uniref:HVO_A0114 family putative DNA-binding protein n=1 Tax=Desulfurobacterium sp. TC5-1 TaxID=1158318 RepID=UPI0003B38D25|nr:transcriptional regulator [Desulfurobacterium sp. TC5-1]
MEKNFWNVGKDRFIKVVLKTPEGNRVIKFSDYESFHKVFSPQRMEILVLLANEKVKSINELSKILNRDAKNVRNDIGILESTGLIRLKNHLNRKIPELVAGSMTVSIEFKNICPISRKRKISKERLEYGTQMLRQKYLPISSIVSPEDKQIERC